RRDAGCAVLAAVLLAAVALGGATLLMKKGTRLHRLFGRTWVALMLGAAIISFWIRRNGDFSPIHLLSIAVIVGVSMAIYAVMRGNIRAHRRGMMATYISLVIAGAFTLLPQRRLGYLVWHSVGLI
ncbi:DUF2306 domain-containing protein, partial [Noviherbaspirillum sp.]|uniref:DUF2306 domain-containing protein n=1 Tax=Noviherbaspirillum sp. TaxID=1926288 RepID=UPI002FE4071B